VTATCPKPARVAHLDLRHIDASVTDATALHRLLTAGMDGTEDTDDTDDMGSDHEHDAGASRFLIVDAVDELTRNQAAYEAVLALGEVRLLCLAVGGPSGISAGGARPGSGPEAWELRRPALLRPPSAGLLWVGDVCPARAHGFVDDRAPGSPGAADDVGALGALVDLLRVPEIFDEVMRALAACNGVAVPALRVLDHDLAPGTRDRAWRQALSRFAGPPGGLTAAGLVSTADLPEPLPELIGAKRMPDGTWEWRRQGGAAYQHFTRCADALRAAEDAHAAIRGVGGLLGHAGRTADLSACLDEAAESLGDYRAVVARALREGDGVAGPPPDVLARLTSLGVSVPSLPALSTGRVGPALRQHIDDLLGARTPLRGASAGLIELAGMAAPGGSAARLVELDERCPATTPANVTNAGHFYLPGAAGGQLAGALAAGALAGLWPGPGWILGPLAASLSSGACLLAWKRRPNRAADHSAGGAASTGAIAQLAAGLLGAAGGILGGQLLGVPAWAGLCAVLVAAVLVGTLTVRRWAYAVDRWWSETGVAEAGEALLGADDVLRDAVWEDWRAAAVRLHCSDSARAVGGMLNRIAMVAEAQADEGRSGTAEHRSGRHQQADPAWNGATGSAESLVVHSAERAPAWLEREAGEGGPELVDTLVGDLADATVEILAPYWGVVERDPADALALPVEQRAGAILAAHRRYLVRCGVAAPPPFGRSSPGRPAWSALLGVRSDALGQILGGAAGPDTVAPLCRKPQLRLLSRDPAVAHWIRFAPVAVRPERAADEDVVWTTAGRFAGVLQLIPLRTDVVRTVRQRHNNAGRKQP
jgi:hypothetical protein